MVDANNATITFSSPQTGTAVATLGAGGGGSSGTSGTSGIVGYTGSFTNLTTWSVTHNLSCDYPLVTVWDNNRYVVVPSGIQSVNSNSLNVYFSSPQTGKVIIGKI
jgi:hypothetical protein